MFDKEVLFSDKQAVSGADVSDNILSLGADAGGGTPLYLEVVAPPTTGSLTVTVNSADDEAMTSPVALAQYAINPDALARGGCVLSAPLPPWSKPFMRIAYGGSPSGAVITAGLTTSPQSGMPQGYREETD
jgi:hypothetical protein